MDKIVIENPRDLVEFLLKEDNARDLVSEVFYIDRGEKTQPSLVAEMNR